MVRIKNSLAGILHITAAKLRFEGFESKEVNDDTPELERRADEGLIELVPDDYEPETEIRPAAPPDEPPVEPPADFDSLDNVDAIEFIDAENDPAVIQSILREEERPGVIDALKARLQEIEDAGQ